MLTLHLHTPSGDARSRHWRAGRSSVPISAGQRPLHESGSHATPHTHLDPLFRISRRVGCATFTTDLTHLLHTLVLVQLLGIPQPTATSTTHAGCTGEHSTQSRPHTWSLWGRTGRRAVMSRERQASRKITKQDSFSRLTHLRRREKRTATSVDKQGRRAPLAAKVGTRGDQDAPFPTTPRTIPSQS